MTDIRPSFCRVCIVSCPIDVTIDSGRVTNVAGDRTNQITGGYTCRKGRAQPTSYDSPDRLRSSLKRRTARRVRKHFINTCNPYPVNMAPAKA